VRLPIIVVLSVLSAAAAWAQQQPATEKARPAPGKNTQGDVLGERPDQVLDLVKLKGVVQKVDLEGRTLTVVSGKQQTGIELSFPQPSGREQIKVSKKLAKTLGKKSLSLEEVKTGSKVQLQYYAALNQMMEIIVSSSGGS